MAEEAPGRKRNAVRSETDISVRLCDRSCRISYCFAARTLPLLSHSEGERLADVEPRRKRNGAVDLFVHAPAAQLCGDHQAQRVDEQGSCSCAASSAASSICSGSSRG